ncbi:MAG: 4-alpha-glucanotransferase [Nitrospirae bacterium]|nr:4-alpha-glucanotransferase [Nitrospirota bacterium]
MGHSEILTRLSRLCGIAPEWHDIWGNRHEVSPETKKALLAAMGVRVGSEAEIADLLREREERPWRRVLPPVLVLREGSSPVEIPISLPPLKAGDAFDWVLTLEDDRQETGRFIAEDLPVREEREIGGSTFTRRAFPLPLVPPAGYHAFHLTASSGDPDLAGDMRLIAAPSSCFRPGALEGTGRVWGPAFQLYGVRSRQNWGIGDFGDLGDAVEFWAKQGAGLVGLNPLHSLFPHAPAHASPYSPSSRLFLNVWYIDVDSIPEFAESETARKLVNAPAFKARLADLRRLDLVDYEKVAASKKEVLEVLYAYFRKTHLRWDDARGRAFRNFQNSQGKALRLHALFEAIQEHFHREDPSVSGWPDWPEEYRDPGAPEVAAFALKQIKRVEFYEYLQWQADLQLGEAARRARDAGMGIGVYRDLAVSIDGRGAEAWANQRTYALGASVGAPPDDFNLKGQDWALPPMVPDRLREAGYAPFIATLRRNMRHAGALRIDHVMGLMRLFWIPEGANPADGAYVHYPIEEMLGILALESRRNGCLVIGEDLGTVPDAVRAALGPMGVLSTRLFYFERSWDGSFKPPGEYPAQAAVAVSTHDLPTLSGWWQGVDLMLRAQLNLFPSDEIRDPQIAERGLDRGRILAALEREGLLPPGVGLDPAGVPEITPDLTAGIHAYVARTPARAMLVQPEDLLGRPEQANLPGTTEEHPNWQRKLPSDLEDWAGDPRLLRTAEALRRERP